LSLLAFVIVAMAYGLRLGQEFPVNSIDTNVGRHQTVVLFGATGTAGDGVLKAVMADQDVAKVHVVTRRLSPRIEAGDAAGKIESTMHSDFLDYAPIHDLLSETDTVYWALGTSALNVSDEQYGVIHVDYPLSLAKEWLSSNSGELSFHLISGMGAGENARLHWAREKARAETELFDLAEGTNMRVISYRPAYIVPTEEQANVGHNFLHTILAPVKFALRSTLIGQAMLEVSARGEQLPNRTILENNEVIRYSNGYSQRCNPTSR
jgi:hypothetical protein